MIVNNGWCQAGVNHGHWNISQNRSTQCIHLHGPLCGLLLLAGVSSSKVSIPMPSWCGQRFLHLISSTECSEIVILHLVVFFTPSLTPTFPKCTPTHTNMCKVLSHLWQYTVLGSLTGSTTRVGSCLFYSSLSMSFMVKVSLCFQSRFEY